MAEEQYVGTLIGVMSKPGSDWHTIEISVPNLRYPVKADTKKAEIIEKVNAVGTEVATWTVNEVESDKTNPKSGKPYINRYLEDVAAGGEIAPTADARQPATSTASGSEKSEVDWDAKERRDYRSRAWGQTLGAFQHLISKEDRENPAALFESLHSFQRLVYLDIVRDLHQEDDDDLPF
jgi:hypothetical protein